MALTEEGLLRVPGLHSRWVRLANGAVAHYVTAGEDGPPIVLLHGGLPGSSGTVGWRFMAPFLAEQGFQVFCPDQPGFGLSDPRPEHWPTRGTLSHVEFLEQFVEAVCLDRFHLAGNSMGCLNTATYAVRYPHRVLSFALIAGMIGDQHPIDLVRHGRIPAPWTGDREAMRRMLGAIVHEQSALTEDLLEMRMRSADRQMGSYNTFRETVLLGQIPEHVKLAITTKDRLDRIGIPAVALWGMDDAAIPVTIGYEVEEALPEVQFFYPENCGHQGQTDQPELFNQVFLEFFRDGLVQRATADRANVSRHRPEVAGRIADQADSAPVPA
ncbi:MAG TPA: alpha/beta hydrolase [Acidimicrobiales bacterium]|nr:alpha/beta hydrolase [Acidimicrobiales bacterium]